jgi:hypothetical protein
MANNKKREKGFYWVKGIEANVWEVMQWVTYDWMEGGQWYPTEGYTDRQMNDDEFLEIDEKRLIHE